MENCVSLLSFLCNQKQEKLNLFIQQFFLLAKLPEVNFLLGLL